MASARSRSKAKSRKEDRENIPVSWISVQPDASTRTSLRSVADYLSEKEAESSLLQHRSKRRLCLSPGSLTALERAEKLVDDAERQLSQLNLDAVLADDFEGDRLVDETSAYIRKIVASSFERGVYEPPPTSIRSKSKLSLASAPASERAMRPGSSERKPVAAAIDDDCLLCSRLCCGSSARADGCVNCSDKLSVQRGPAISIKADLCVRTSRIVDIQPSRDPLPRSRGGPADNVANFEFHHESFANDESAAAEKFEAPGTRDATTSITGLAQPVERSSDCSPAAAEPPEPRPRLDASSDADLSLGEPGIIAELDALLSQQRTIIRKVHQSSQALDELLRKSAASEARSPRSSGNGADYSAESFDSVLHSRDSCKSNAGFIENLKSSSLQLPKPSNLDVDSTDVNGRKEIGGDVGRGIDADCENGSSINVDANARESRASSDINTSKVNESRGPSVIADDEKIREKESGDAIDVDEEEETEREDSLHKTSHLVDSLSDDQSLKQLSTQLIVQSRLDSKAMPDNQHNSSCISIRSARADSVLTASAQLIVSRQKSVDFDRASAREYSTISANSRPLLATSQHVEIALLEPPSPDHQKLCLLKKLESCSIPARQHRCKRLPFTSTVLSDAVAVQSTCSNVESSELSSEATHSEGEFYLSSSASYSLGEVRRKNADSIARSHSSSTKASSTSSASQLKTPTFQCSIGEFIGPI